jgi:hypothetical protein
MAKADTRRMERGGFMFKPYCQLCGNKPTHRAFYYPTVFNGDAEWLGDFCDDHKDTDLNALPIKEF